MITTDRPGFARPGWAGPVSVGLGPRVVGGGCHQLVAASATRSASMHQGPAIGSGGPSRRTVRSGRRESPAGTAPGAGRHPGPGVRGGCGRSWQRGRRDPATPASPDPRPPPCREPGRVRDRGGLSAGNGTADVARGAALHRGTQFPGRDHSGRNSPLPAGAMSVAGYPARSCPPSERGVAAGPGQSGCRESRKQRNTETTRLRVRGCGSSPAH
jgi:hypothetical protein